MRILRQALVFTIVLASSVLGTLGTRSAQAQGDWQVRRDPFDKRIVARYKAILKRKPSDRGALAKLVGMYRRYRSVKLLVSQYQAAVNKSPNSFSNNVVLGHLYARQAASDKALAMYEKAATIKPKNAALQVALADVYRTKGRIREAKTAYDVALANTKSKKIKKHALRKLADISLGKKDIDGARAYYDQLIGLEPRNVQIRLELGDALHQHGKHKEAIRVYKDAERRLRSDPARRVEVVARIGAAYEKAGEEETAIREYRRAMKMVRRGYYLRRELTSRVIDIYRRRQGLVDLIKHYEKTWRRKKRGHFEWDTLARLYQETGRQEKAVEAFRIATKKAPYELDTQRKLISLLENSGREEEALEQYEIVIRVAPGEPRFQLELAERYWNRGQTKKALALLKKMERRFPGDGSVHAAVADYYTRWGEEDLALKAYIRLAKIEPHDVGHLVALGEQYFQRGKRKKAITTWKKIIARKTADNYARLGEVYSEHDMRPEALVMYSRAVKMEPNNADFYKGRGGVYERMKRYTESIADWHRVLDLTPIEKKSNKPARREARRRIVHLWRRSGPYKLRNQVTVWTNAFFKGTPPNVDAAWFLVEKHTRDRESKLARRVLERLLALNEQDTDAMQNLVRVYRRQREFDKAVAILLSLVKLMPGREREYYTTIAEIKTDARQDDEAIYYVQKALEMSPNDPVAHMRLAERYEAMQDEAALKKAIKAYERTIELDERNYTAYFRLARLYQRETSTHMKSAALYRRIVKQASDNEIIEKGGRKAIALEELTKTLGELENVVAPMAFTFGHKKVYRRLLVELYARYVPWLVGVRRRGGSKGAAAKKEMIRLGSHGLAPLLEALNDDKDPSQQRIAVSVLGHLSNKGAAAPLVRLALKPLPDGLGAPRRMGMARPSVDVDTRVEALIAAGRLGDARIIPQLIKLSKSTERAMREAAVFGLGRTRDKKAAPTLLVALNDSIESVQAQACFGLAHIKGSNVVAALEAVVKDESRSDTTRAACAYGIGVHRDPAGMPVLIATLAQGNDEAQRLSAWALGEIGDRRAIPALLSAHFNRHERIRTTIAWALASITTKSHAKTDIEIEYRVRNGTFDAASAVRSIPGDLVVAQLPPTVILGHESQLIEGIRDALDRHTDLQVRILASLDSHETRLSLGALTDHVAPATGAAAAKLRTAIDRVGKALLPDLERLTGHHDSKVRGMALSVLSKIDSPTVLAILRKGLADKDSTVRRAAMRAAAVYGVRRPAAANALIQVVASRLTADDWLERTDAAEALGRFGPGAASSSAQTAPLIAALTDEYGYVREAAARSLGRVGGRGAAAALQAATNDADPAVSRAALAAIKKLRK